MSGSHPGRGGIGVFDSGVGGLTVARALRRRLPAHPITYLGDTARLPYGTKSATTVARYTERNVRFLLERGVDVVVVACNSASALALDQESPGWGDASADVLGVIRPGAERAAAVAKQRIGVVATEATIGSDAYARAIHDLRPELEVMSVACPLLVPLVEEDWLQDPITEEVVRRYTEPLRDAGVDTLILGCTHYPLLRPVFAAVMGPEVELVDSATAVSEAVAELLEAPGVGSGGSSQSELSPVPKSELRVFVTDSSPRFGRIAEAVLGEPITMEWIDTP